MAKYVTKDKDTLDHICWRYYGRQSGAGEAVLEANPNLADIGVTLPAGIVIELPNLDLITPDQTVRLWD
ncbi:MAG: phage tail protein [Proteobacteria bacterium]|nr:MAG: phage tail protein [Pseudomonadota bacterium]